MRRFAVAVLALMVVALFGLGVVIPVALTAQDSTAVGVPSAGAQLVSLGGFLLGLAGVVVTGILKKVAAKVDGTTAEWDGAAVAFYKPFQPIVAMVAALLIAKLGLPGVSGDAFAAAPVGTVLAIGLRELATRLGLSV